MRLDLRSAKDEQEFAAGISRYAAGLPKGHWILGGQWDHEAWPSRKRPTRWPLDAVASEHPVFLHRLDGHIAVSNSLALKRAGVTKDTPDPFGGTIERDPATGEPTGILIDKAISLVGKVIPEPVRADYVNGARAAMRQAARLGVTSVQSPGTANDFRACQELWRNGELSTRLYVMLGVDHWRSMQNLGLQPGFGDSMLRLGAAKLFADGSLGARSALFFEPYKDDPSTAGLAIHPEEELGRIVADVDRAGLQVALHAIGDKAVHWALNAFERAIQGNGSRDARHRIEHAQAIQPSDRPRFAQLGVIASIQPSHCIDDMRWVENRLGRRCQFAYPFRSLLEAGARIALSTDWNVEPLDPMLTLYAAVTREFATGGPPGGWHPAEKVTIEQAIEAYTLGSAYAEFQERQKGSLERGKLADMAILSQNLLALPPTEILNTRPLATIVGGRVVFDEEEHQ
jgi:predicted amidohydrolase YtcJ